MGRKYKQFGMILILLLLSVNIMSCSEDREVADPPSSTDSTDNVVDPEQDHGGINMGITGVHGNHQETAEDILAKGLLYILKGEYKINSNEEPGVCRCFY